MGDSPQLRPVEKTLLSPYSEMEAYGLSAAEIHYAGGARKTNKAGILAFRQGLVEAASGEPNPDFPDEQRNLPEYAIGASTVRLSQERTK